MAIFNCNIFSKKLFASTSITVILPIPHGDFDPPEKAARYPRNGETYPVLYLLHGFSADETDWLRHSRIEDYAYRHQIAVVLPAIGNNFYQNLSFGENGFDYLTEELPSMMQSIFPISGEREKNFIGGLSMGGYGALYAALKKPEKYKGVASFSGGLNISWVYKLMSSAENIEGTDTMCKRMEMLFGENVAENIGEKDLVYLLEKNLAERIKIPDIYLCIGTEDIIYEGNSAFREAAESSDLHFLYEEGPGAHNFDFWDVYIQRALHWLIPN